MTTNLKNKRIVACAPELSAGLLTGIVVATDGDCLAIHLSTPINMPGGKIAPWLVASLRYKKQSLTDIEAGQRLLCALTLVPAERFNPSKPCDVSWWRGGFAAIGDVELNDNTEQEKQP